LLRAIEGLPVDFALIGLEVDFERNPLARLMRELAEPAELVFRTPDMAPQTVP